MSASHRPFGWPRIRVSSIDSTMPAMSELARSGAVHGSVLVADFQTAGTGRDRRAWMAPAGSALLFSVLIKTSRPQREVPLVSLLVGGCVADTLVEFGIESRVKWPNDVLVGGNKISGILVRSQSAPGGDQLDLIVGIGLNLTNQATFGLDRAANLEDESGGLVDRDEMLDRLLDHIGRMASDFEFGQVASRVQRVRDRLAMLGEKVTIDVGRCVISGTLEGLRDDGALEIRTSSGDIEIVMSGEFQRGPTSAISEA